VKRERGKQRTLLQPYCGCWLVGCGLCVCIHRQRVGEEVLLPVTPTHSLGVWAPLGSVSTDGTHCFRWVTQWQHSGVALWSMCKCCQLPLLLLWQGVRPASKWFGEAGASVPERITQCLPSLVLYPPQAEPFPQHTLLVIWVCMWVYLGSPMLLCFAPTPSFTPRLSSGGEVGQGPAAGVVCRPCITSVY
jgi:hypothetical protein